MHVGPYEVTERLGQGAVGIVFAARSPSGAAVAIKLLQRSTPEELARFEREARLQSQLGAAAGFVPLLEVGRCEQGPYLVMPLLRGGTLRDRLRRGPLGVPETVELGVTLARALGRAHALGVVHRDVKPENVLFDAVTGEPLIADLGLAKHFSSDAPGASRSASLSATGTLRGTAGYMAPEQAADSRNAGPAADVFSLGAILHECIAGRPAFSGESFLAVIERVEKGQVERLEAPRWLEALVRRALARDPAERFPDGEAFATALEESALAASRPRSKAPRLAAALIGVALASFAILRARAPEPPPPATPKNEVDPMRRLLDAAERGDVAAMSSLAKVFASGRGTPRDFVASVKWSRKAAEAGDASSMTDLGWALEFGRGCGRDLVEAVLWYRRAADAGHPIGVRNLGTCYRDGKGVEKNEAEALRLFRLAAEMGEVGAMNSLGAMLFMKGAAEDEEAVAWFKKAVALGSAGAMRNMGVAYESGHGVPKDEAEAVRWYRKSADAGDVNGMTSLAVMLANGRGVAQDEAEAIRWYRRASDGGDFRAMINLGLLLEHGRGTPKDEAEAARLYQKAADRGDAVGMTNLGNMYRSGLGVAKDQAEAIRWFRKAAEAGNARGMVHLAEALETPGPFRDDAEALRWLRKAAELGDRDARNVRRKRGG